MSRWEFTALLDTEVEDTSKVDYVPAGCGGLRNVPTFGDSALIPNSNAVFVFDAFEALPLFSDSFESSWSGVAFFATNRPCHHGGQ